MPTRRINKTSVDALWTGEAQAFLWDEDLRGFGVKATASGAKSYLIQYRIGGRGAKVKRYTIGRHGSPWTPDTARTEAKRLLIEVGQGIDVAAMKQERSRRAPDLAFKSYCERFVDRCLKERWSRSWEDAKGTLDRHAIPLIRDKALTEVTRVDVKEALDRLRGHTATRRKLYAILRRMFRWAVSEGDLERSPLEGLEAPPIPHSRDRVLADWELQLVFGAAGAMGEPFGPLIRLLILTGQRMQEVAASSWSELDRAAAILSIPAQRAKNGRATDVPLSEAALAEFDAIAGGERWPRKGLIFSTTGKTPVSGFSRAKRQIDRKVLAMLADADDERTVAPWRYHDLRRTLATGLQRLGVRFEVTEAVLNHISGSKGGVAGIYQRHDWKEEKRAALEAWSAHVTAAASAASNNVLPFARVK